MEIHECDPDHVVVGILRGEDIAVRVARYVMGILREKKADLDR